MGKIIVDNRSRQSDIDALIYVLTVMREGRISGSGDKAQYCYHTGFTDGTEVVAYLNKRSDKFIVYDEERINDVSQSN